MTILETELKLQELLFSKAANSRGIIGLTLIIINCFSLYLQSICLRAGTEYLPHRTDPAVLELNKQHKTKKC